MSDIKYAPTSEEVHNARFAEACRANYLALSPAEMNVFVNNKARLNPLKCEQEIYLGFFFDGTNNNKYRDISSNSQSNVARLFDVFIGTPTLVDNSRKTITASYGGQPDLKFKPDGFPEKEFKFYRKVYVPGLGTAFPEIKDPGEGTDKKLGLATALHGHNRIIWALIQFANQVHAVFTDEPLYDAQQTASLFRKMSALENAASGLTILDANAPSGVSRTLMMRQIKADLIEKLKPIYLCNKPTITRIRVSIFGFSRGSAEARTFVNWLIDGYGDSIAGAPIQIDILGIFDTVASVGAAHITHVADGHMAWADGENMTIPPEVKRCVHLVSSHEVRMCFPLDSVCVNNKLPPNCKEIVYPGVHSDVGGGYPIYDQGRCPTNEDRISQITLAHMYREGLMAAVPLAAPHMMRVQDKLAFKVGENIKNAFNAYVEKTRVGSVKATGGKGKFGMLFPEETQPPEPIHTLIRRHYCHYLAWRKLRLNNMIEKLPGFHAANNTNSTKKQDIYDIKRTNDDLKKELAHANQITYATPSIVMASAGGAGLARMSADLKSAAMAEIMPLWQKFHLDETADKALIQLFDEYVHDSRAWFKFGGKSDDEWFGGGNDAQGTPRVSLKTQTEQAAIKKETALQAKLNQSISRLEKMLELQGKQPQYGMLKLDLERDKKELAASKARLAKIKTDGALNGGDAPLNENWTVAGYLRWRTIYTTTNSRSSAKKQMNQFKLRILQDQILQARLKDNQEKLAALEKSQTEYIRNYLLAVKQNREPYLKAGNLKELRAYDEGCNTVLQMILKPMGPKYAALRSEIEAQQRELELP